VRYVPPPPPRRRRAEHSDPLRRIIETEEARSRAEERPFDPDAPREHYSGSHHFAVNEGDLDSALRQQRSRRYKVLVIERSGERVLASPRSYGFMSVEEAGRWAASNLSEGVPFELRGYVRGSPQDPRMLVSSLEHNARRGEAADPHAATELVLFIENTADLSPDGPSGQGHSVLLNALRKWRKGSYEPALAVRLFEYLAESGAKRYAHEFDHASRWSEMFNPATRRDVARQLEESFRNSAERGEYDDVDVRIQR